MGTSHPRVMHVILASVGTLNIPKPIFKVEFTFMFARILQTENI